jgi:predicted metal-dependent hydrolase
MKRLSRSTGSLRSDLIGLDLTVCQSIVEAHSETSRVTRFTVRLQKSMTELPDYMVRESARAKNVRLTVSVHDGLVIVVPKGFDHAQIPGILVEKERWIDRAMAGLARRRELMAPVDELPERIVLLAIGEDWTVEPQHDEAMSVRITEQIDGRVLIHGKVDAPDLWRAALRSWVVGKAKQRLVPWLEAVAKEHDFQVGKVSIRCQKTRWASHSERGTISLNAQLLFVPPELVRYVLLHELCHSVHLDHSTRFWDLLQQNEPETDTLRKEFRAAWSFVPGWFAADHQKRRCDSSIPAG